MDDSELKKLRAAVMEREGLVAEIFELLRRVPKRLLMILKLSDLQRSLDHSLHTTHGQVSKPSTFVETCAHLADTNIRHRRTLLCRRCLARRCPTIPPQVAGLRAVTEPHEDFY